MKLIHGQREFGSAFNQYDSHSIDRCRPAGEVSASRDTNGVGASGLHDLELRVAIEQALTLGWERYVGSFGRIIGMKTFGSSAPLKELEVKFGFEPDRVVEVVKELREKQDFLNLRGKEIA
jgi:hypothetical protein